MRFWTPKRNRGFVIGLVKGIGLYLISSIGWVLSYTVINPFSTPVMVQRALFFKEGNGLRTGKWVTIEKMGRNMPHAVLAAEDQKFFVHNGFDFEGIQKAANSTIKGKGLRGGSTITQQTAKNLFLLPHRTIIRKGFEVYYTFLLEMLLSKNRILELYLNSIEYAPGIFGIAGATKYYYNISPSQLKKDQAIRLSGVLPAPRKWSPKAPTPNYTRHVKAIRRNWRYVGYTTPTP